MFCIIVFVVVLLSCKSHEQAVKGNSSRRYWSYDDEKPWPGSKCQAGIRQSPIDIVESNVIIDWDENFVKGPLAFKGYEAVLMTGVNNGFTVQLSTDGEPWMHPEITGGPLRHSYRLEQVHFHWLSEHSINGRKYPMEIHFVHVRKDLTVQEALKERDGLAILAIMCNVKTWLTESDQDPLFEVVDFLPQLKSRGNRHSGVVLDLTRLLGPPSTKNFYAYSGSLTSPECNEVVIWIIYEVPLPMSARQHQLFTDISRLKNYRELQSIKSIKVYVIKPDSIFEKPSLVAAVGNIFQGMKGFFNDVKRYTIMPFTKIKQLTKRSW